MHPVSRFSAKWFCHSTRWFCVCLLVCSALLFSLWGWERHRLSVTIKLWRVRKTTWQVDWCLITACPIVWIHRHIFKIPILQTDAQIVCLGLYMLNLVFSCYLQRSLGSEIKWEKEREIVGEEERETTRGGGIGRERKVSENRLERGRERKKAGEKERWEREKMGSGGREGAGW